MNGGAAARGGGALTQREISELLDAALAAARAGAEVLEAGLGAALRISGKAEAGNLVTEIDVAAEHAVREVLAVMRPGDRVTGEELPDSDREGAAVRWSIDPLDGTTNYTRRIPYFATSLGAQDTATGEWLVGVVHAPALRRVYSAARDLGAWLQEGGERRRLSGPSGASSARVLGVGLAYDPATREYQYDRLRERMDGYTTMRAFGAGALNICAVADGALDAYIEEDLEEYDWAGAAVIAEQAGLTVLRPTADDRLLRVFPAA
jgi:myo-inositol-1(or 4)-monophosphatase